MYLHIQNPGTIINIITSLSAFLATMLLIIYTNNNNLIKRNISLISHENVRIDIRKFIEKNEF